MARAFTQAGKELIRQNLLRKGREYFIKYGLKKTSVDELAKSGCASVYIMVESGSQRMLSFLHKKYSVDEIEKAFWLFASTK